MYRRIIDCCCCSYDQLQDLQDKQNWSYESIKTDLEDVKERWEKLQTDTLNKVKEAQEEFSPYLTAQPDKETAKSIRERAKELSDKFKRLEKRHYEIEGEVESDIQLITRRYDDCQTRRNNIVVHGKKAVIGAIFLGAILGGAIAWEKFDGKPEFVICGALVGAVGLGLIGVLAYSIFRKTAESGVTKWETLNQKIPELETMDKSIEEKTQIVRSFPFQLDAFEDCDIMIGCEELVTQCDKYLEVF